MIDSDRHVMEPPELEELVLPHVGDRLRRRVLAPVTGRYHAVWGTKEWVRPLAVPKPAEVHLADMDREGVDVAVYYPSASLMIGIIDDAAQAIRLARAYNNWIAEFCAADPARLKPVAVVAPQDATWSAEEITRRVQGDGFVGVVMPTWMPEKILSARALDPIYGTAAGLDVPVAFHTVVPVHAMPDRFRDLLSTHAIAQPSEMMAASASLVVGGVLERHASLRVAFLESGLGWVPFWMERLDAHHEKLRDEVPYLTMRPSDYLTGGRCYFHCEPDEKMLPYCIEVMGDDCIMYASDYPHWDCSFPHSARTLQARGDISTLSKKKILDSNTRTFYRLPSGREHGQLPVP